MDTLKISHKKAGSISGGIFLVCLGIVALLGSWWPGILLAIGAALASKQFFYRKIYDMCVTVAIFGGLFVVIFFGFSQEVLIPVILIVAGLHLIFREYFVPENETELERDEDIEQEIEENNN